MPTRESPPDPRPDLMAGPLAGCRDAEDYFQVLGVAYDERVLAAGRLHVMRLFGRELEQAGATGAPADDLPACRAALERAYATLLDGGPLRHRVFKVLADRAPGQLIPDDELGIDPDPVAVPAPDRFDTAVDASPDSLPEPDGGDPR